MLEVLGSLLPGFALGRSIVPATEALEQPPNTYPLRWLRAVAITMFLLAAVLLLAAAHVDTVQGNREFSN